MITFSLYSKPFFAIMMLLTISITLVAQKKNSGNLATNKIQPCYVGLFLKSVDNFQPGDYSFSTDFWIWFNCRDTCFKPLDNIEFINSKHVDTSEVYHKVYNKISLWSEFIKAKVNHNWTLKDYPFDEQTLEIDVEAGLDNSKMILLDTEKMKADDELNAPGWKIDKSRSYWVQTKVYDSDFGDHSLNGKSYYSKIVYKLILKRDSWGLFFKLLTGLYIAFLVSFLAFFINTTRDSRLGLGIGGLFAAIANKYIADNNIPEGIRFSTIDMIHDITFIAILITIVLSVITIAVDDKKRELKRRKFDELTRWPLLILYVICNAVVVIISIVNH
jgi:hypothetical protein